MTPEQLEQWDLWRSARIRFLWRENHCSRIFQRIHNYLSGAASKLAGGEPPGSLMRMVEQATKKPHPLHIEHAYRKIYLAEVKELCDPLYARHKQANPNSTTVRVNFDNQVVRLWIQFHRELASLPVDVHGSPIGAVALKYTDNTYKAIRDFFEELCVNFPPPLIDPPIGIRYGRCLYYIQHGHRQGDPPPEEVEPTPREYAQYVLTTGLPMLLTRVQCHQDRCQPIAEFPAGPLPSCRCTVAYTFRRPVSSRRRKSTRMGVRGLHIETS
jgi:hypothetical protein